MLRQNYDGRGTSPTRSCTGRRSITCQNVCNVQATAKAEPEALQRKRAADFLKAYEPFDWTAQL